MNEPPDIKKYLSILDMVRAPTPEETESVTEMHSLSLSAEDLPEEQVSWFERNHEGFLSLLKDGDGKEFERLAFPLESLGSVNPLGRTTSLIDIATQMRGCSDRKMSLMGNGGYGAEVRQARTMVVLAYAMDARKRLLSVIRDNSASFDQAGGSLSVVDTDTEAVQHVGAVLHKANLKLEYWTELRENRASTCMMEVGLALGLPSWVVCELYHSGISLFDSWGRVAVGVRTEGLYAAFLYGLTLTTVGMDVLWSTTGLLVKEEPSPCEMAEVIPSVIQVTATGLDVEGEIVPIVSVATLNPALRSGRKRGRIKKDILAGQYAELAYRARHTPEVAERFVAAAKAVGVGPTILPTDNRFVPPTLAAIESAIRKEGWHYVMRAGVKRALKENRADALVHEWLNEANLALPARGARQPKPPDK